MRPWAITARGSTSWVLILTRNRACCGIMCIMPRYEEQPCLSCGKLRRVQVRAKVPISSRCHPCGAKHRAETRIETWRSRENHPRWRGGIHNESNGYRSIVVPLDSPYLPMADSRGRVYEHRLVVAQRLGRCLERNEEVHHVNGDKHDNADANLELLSKREHAARYHAEVLELRAEVSRLRKELRQARAS